MSSTERYIHSLYKELEDSIVIKNVKRNNNKITFDYKNRSGEVIMENANPVLLFSGKKTKISSLLSLTNALDGKRK